MNPTGPPDCDWGSHEREQCSRTCTRLSHSCGEVLRWAGYRRQTMPTSSTPGHPPRRGDLPRESAVVRTGTLTDRHLPRPEQPLHRLSHERRFVKIYSLLLDHFVTYGVPKEGGSAGSSAIVSAVPEPIRQLDDHLPERRVRCPRRRRIEAPWNLGPPRKGIAQKRGIVTAGDAAFGRTRPRER
jgi:hypothetical protein